MSVTAIRFPRNDDLIKPRVGPCARCGTHSKYCGLRRRAVSSHVMRLQSPALVKSSQVHPPRAHRSRLKIDSWSSYGRAAKASRARRCVRSMMHPLVRLQLYESQRHRQPGLFWLFAIDELVSDKPERSGPAIWRLSGDGQCRE